MAWNPLRKHASQVQTHGTSESYRLAKTSRLDQLPAWQDIAEKPSSFTPSNHKLTHASGGADALAPSDIGAVQNAGDTPSMLADAEINRPAAGVAGRIFIATDTKRIYRDDGTAWAQLPLDLPLGATINSHTVWHAGNDGAGSGLDADYLRGLAPGNEPDNLLKLDSTGKVPVENLPGAGTFNFAGSAPYSGTFLQRSAADGDNAAWLSVGPTGSNASVIWTALDAVPAGARGVRLNLYAEAYGAAGASISAKVRAAGSTVTPTKNAIYIVAPGTDYVYQAQNTVDVQLNASRQFEFLWDKSTVSGQTLGLRFYLEGWYA